MTSGVTRFCSVSDSWPPLPAVGVWLSASCPRRRGVSGTLPVSRALPVPGHSGCGTGLRVGVVLFSVVVVCRGLAGAPVDRPPGVSLCAVCACLALSGVPDGWLFTEAWGWLGRVVGDVRVCRVGSAMAKGPVGLAECGVRARMRCVDVVPGAGRGWAGGVMERLGGISGEVVFPPAAHSLVSPSVTIASREALVSLGPPMVSWLADQPVPSRFSLRRAPLVMLPGARLRSTSLPCPRPPSPPSSPRHGGVITMRAPGSIVL